MFPIAGLDGRLIAEHVRTDFDDGSKSVAWRRPGCSPEDGLAGLTTAELPLYGSDRLAALEAGRTVIVTEGEKAAEALWGLGVQAVGTVTGASATPGEHALAVLLPFDVVLWPDHDPEGRGHMARVAARLIRLGGACRLLHWREATQKGDDAADFAERGGSLSDTLALIAAAKRIEAVYVDAPRPTPIRRLPSYGDADDRKDRARESLVDVVSHRLGPPSHRQGRSLFWRCPFHEERTASFKVDLHEPFFRCFGCGVRGDVFTFISQIDGRSFKETLAELAPRPYTGILGRYAE